MLSFDAPDYKLTSMSSSSTDPWLQYTEESAAFTLALHYSRKKCGVNTMSKFDLDLPWVTRLKCYATMECLRNLRMMNCGKPHGCTFFQTRC
jgi:hypothetical protein